jgi:hypothetical protein
LGKLERWASSQIGVAETDAKRRGRARENFMVSKIWVSRSSSEQAQSLSDSRLSPPLFAFCSTVSPISPQCYLHSPYAVVLFVQFPYVLPVQAVLPLVSSQVLRM